MPFPHALRALDHRDFRRFYVAQLLALVGGWMQAVAQAWLVLQLTDSPFRLGLISTLQFLPILVFSVVTGAMADRLPKRALLVATQTTLACQAFLLGALVATGRVEYWHVAALGLALGFANVFDQPARQSFVMEMVGKGDVANAVALNSAAFNAARIVGPAVAGVLIAQVGVGPAFFVNGAGFVGVILTLGRLEARGLPARAGRATMLEEILEGRSEEHTSELQSHSDLVCRLLLEKKKSPQIAPVWVDLDGDSILVCTGEGSLKAKNSKRDARIGCSVKIARAHVSPPVTYASRMPA